MYKMVDRKKFRSAIKEIIGFVLMVFAVVWFCIFIYQHSGLNLEMPKANPKKELAYEFVTYEYVMETDASNHRVKRAVPQKVIYRYIDGSR